mgnify:CR=1 FL=1
MIRHGRTSSGRQRWRCKPCKITTLNEIDSTAKHLDEFVAWLLGRRRQVDLPGGGRSFRRRCEPLWQLWPFSPIVDEVHEVIFVDGIHLGRNAVVLIAKVSAVAAATAKIFLMFDILLSITDPRRYCPHYSGQSALTQGSFRDCKTSSLFRKSFASLSPQKLHNFHASKTGGRFRPPVAAISISFRNDDT